MLPTALDVDHSSIPEGRHGQRPMTVRTLADAFRRVGSTSRWPTRPLGETCPTTTTRRPTRLRRWPRCSRSGQGCRRGPRRRPPSEPRPRRGRAGARGQDGPRADAEAGAARPAPATYDLILIDRPPSLGLPTVNALVAADQALIPSEAEYFSLQGVEQALEVIELAKESLHPDLGWLGVVLNIADMRLARARGADPAEGALRREGLDTVVPKRPLRGVGGARRVDPRLRARPRRRLRERSRRRSSPAWAATTTRPAASWRP